MDYTVHGILQATGVGSRSLLQGIFPTHVSNPGLPHCRRILYQLSHKGSPRILARVSYFFSSGSSWPRNWTRVSSIAGGFFTTDTTWEAPEELGMLLSFVSLYKGHVSENFPWKMWLDQWIQIDFCRLSARKNSTYLRLEWLGHLNFADQFLK